MSIDNTDGLRRVAAVLGILAIVSAVAGPVDARRVYAGKVYADVRRQLIQAGLVPIKISHDPGETICYEGLCKRYPEVIDCGGSGIHVCSFAWVEKGERYKIVETYGESMLIVDKVRYAYRFEVRDIKSHKRYSFPEDVTR